tara:strand:+ start:196 stop:561 length:366 start_codon:yes stop_codon:yes gene_type:complete
MKVVFEKYTVLTTTWGSNPSFKANEPKEVGPEIAAAALLAGGKEVRNGPTAKVVIKETIAAPEPIGPDQQLIEALEGLISLGDPDNFKADGTPKASVVNKAVGRTVRTDERDAAWELALNS